MKLKRLVLSALVCATLPSLQSAYAQGELEEILVTASKKGTTSLLDTAITATVVTGDQLEFREIRNVEDLQAQAPGAIIDSGGSAPILSIRGIGHDSFLLSAENGVTIYANDVLMGRPYSMTAPFFDLQRVDVLKGPQGTSFGRNASGGSINFVSRRPEEGLSVDLGVLGGSFDRQEVHGIVNYGTSDWGVRIGVKDNEDDGFGDNLATGEDAGGIDSTVVKGAIAFTPSDTFEAVLRVDYTDEKAVRPVQTMTVPEPFSIPAVFGATVSLDEGEDYEFYNDLDAVSEVETTMATLHIEWDIGDLHLRSVTGFLDTDQLWIGDDDDSDLLLIKTDSLIMESEQFSQEFVLSGEAGSVDWLTGVYYLTEDVDQDLSLVFFRDFSPAGGSRVSDDSQELTSMAVFGSGTWNINDLTRLTAGLRYSQDEKDFDYNASFVLGPLSPAPGFAQPLCVDSFDDDWDDLTWDLTLERDLTEDTFSYVKVNTGYKAGGFDAFACGLTFDQEEITSYEIGYKGTFRDGTITLSTSAFYYDYTDLQVSQVFTDPATGAPVVQTVNAAEAEVYGIDLEFRALFSDSWSADIALSWVPTAEYDDFSRVDEKDYRVFTRTGVADPLDLSGNRLNRAPEYSGTAGLNFNTELGGDWRMDARLELYFVDDIAFSPFDRPNAYNVSIGVAGPEQKDTNIQEGYELLNLYLSVHYGENWTVRAYAKNLTDEYYFTGSTENSTTGHTWINLGRPREGGVQIIYRFVD